MSNHPDAIVIGSGPNGLSAAIVLARTGRRVVVYESQPTIGGGARSAELTLPGFIHDLGSAVHPFAVVSPMFKSIHLERYGVEWVEPPVMFAHPLDDGSAVGVQRSIDATAGSLGADRDRYARLFRGLARDWPSIEALALGHLRFPRHPFAAARFGVHAVRSAVAFATRRFVDPRTRALFAGVAAHGMLPLERRPSAAFGLVLTALAHVVGWPMPRGGAQRITDALAADLRSHGGEIITGAEVRSIEELPPSPLILCDVSPRALVRIAGRRFPPWYRRQLERYRHGPGAFKIDWALDAPIPWRAELCERAGTVHLGGTMEQIAHAEREVWDGRAPERPYMIVVQPTRFDPSRAPAGRHTAWAYCHTPNGSAVDMVPRMEAELERHAPGFRDRVLARAVMPPAELERSNANLVGGDIAGGATTFTQLFGRPTWRWYTTPARGVYICSSSTPPGVGVHGMCGYLAATKALGDIADR